MKKHLGILMVAVLSIISGCKNYDKPPLNKEVPLLKFEELINCYGKDTSAVFSNYENPMADYITGKNRQILYEINTIQGAYILTYILNNVNSVIEIDGQINQDYTQEDIIVIGKETCNILDSLKQLHLVNVLLIGDNGRYFESFDEAFLQIEESPLNKSNALFVGWYSEDSYFDLRITYESISFRIKEHDPLIKK